MKLRLHWTERFEVVREYPTFELDSAKHPELELEMLNVYSAGTPIQQEQALADLEYKMHHTEDSQRGETIFQMIGPYNSFSEAQEYPITEQAGSLCLADTEKED
jgi:hypothetical protein